VGNHALGDSRSTAGWACSSWLRPQISSAGYPERDRLHQHITGTSDQRLLQHVVGIQRRAIMIAVPGAASAAWRARQRRDHPDLVIDQPSGRYAIARSTAVRPSGVPVIWIRKLSASGSSSSWTSLGWPGPIQNLIILDRLFFHYLRSSSWGGRLTAIIRAAQRQ